MEKISYNLVFNRKKRLNKKGMALVQVEAYLNRRKIYFSTKIYLKPEQWDTKRRMVKGHPNADVLNRMLYEHIAAIEQIELGLWQQGKSISLELLKDSIDKPVSNGRSFLTFFREEVANSSLKESTRQNHLSTLELLQEFKKEVQFTDLTFEFVSSFDNYLQSKGYHLNTIAKHMKHLKRYVNVAINKDYMDVQKYAFRKYKIISNLRKENRSLDLLHRHLDELIKDQSHITVKFRRTLMFLITGMYNAEPIYHLRDIQNQAEEYAKDNNQFDVLPHRDLADFLPPPIFDIEFRIVRREHIQNGQYNDRNIIPFWSLSSGERQVAYVISNFVYHLVNINSVHTIEDEKVAGLPLLKYKYVNVVFDEIELYFHPDLQRRFLSLIISALRNIHIEHIEGINLLMVTHSPFVLSDIPRSNVLVLSKHKEIAGETFCANIHDMLGQSFFMEYSMGQIAQEEIEEIFCRYNRNQPISENDLKRYKYMASIVGDEYLHSTLERVMTKLERRLDGRNEE